MVNAVIDGGGGGEVTLLMLGGEGWENNTCDLSAAAAIQRLQSNQVSLQKLLSLRNRQGSHFPDISSQLLAFPAEEVLEGCARKKEEKSTGRPGFSPRGDVLLSLYRSGECQTLHFTHIFNEMLIVTGGSDTKET